MSAIPCLLRWREHHDAGNAEREQPMWLEAGQFPVVPLAMAQVVSGLPAGRISEARLRVVDSRSDVPETLKKQPVSRCAE